MDSLVVVLVLRLLHVVGGVVWVGAMVVVTWFLLPATKTLGNAGQVMPQIMLRNGLARWLGIVGAVTVISGALLYYRAMHTTGGSFGASPAGMAFGTGGALAIVAAVIGGAVSTPTGRKIGVLGQQIQQARGRPEPAQIAEMQALQRRSENASRAVAILLLLAAAAMSVARYV